MLVWQFYNLRAYWLIGLVITFLFAPKGVFSQDFSEISNRMKALYHNEQAFEIEMQMDVYEGESSNASVYTERIIIRKNESNYQYQMTKQEMLMNSQYIINVDHDTKVISYSLRDLVNEKQVLNNRASELTPNLDSLQKAFGEPKLIGKEGNSLKYQYIMKSGDIKEMQMLIEPTQPKLERITYLYPEGQKVIIKFIRMEIMTNNKDTFSEKPYFTLESGAVKINANYKGYKVVKVN